MTIQLLQLLPLGACYATAALCLAAPAQAQTDPSFGSGGYAVVGLSDGPSGVEAIALGPDGAVYAVGDDESSSDGSRFAVVRLRPDGSLDATFGDGGAASVRARPTGTHLPDDIVRLPDGSLIITGDVNNEAFAARLTAAGTLDAAYGQGGISETLFRGDVAEMVSLGGGTVLIAGTQQGTNELVLAQVDAQGRLDGGFGTGGIVVSPGSDGETYTVTGLALAPGGNVVVSGYIVSAEAGYDVFAVRYSLGGVRDLAFGTGGLARANVGAVDFAGPVAVRPDGRVLVGGRVFQATTFVVQFTPGGRLDTGFGSGGLFTHTYDEGDDTVRDLELLADGRLLLTGAINSRSVAGSPSVSSLYVARLTPSGGFDTTFGVGGFVRAEFPVGSFSDGRAIAVVPTTGAIVAAGRALSTDAGAGFGFVRLLPDARPTDSEAGPGARMALHVDPNPSAGPVTLSCPECAMTDARVVVFDVVGREVGVVHDGSLGAHWRLRLPSLSPGTYLVRVTSPEGAGTRQFIVVR